MLLLRLSRLSFWLAAALAGLALLAPGGRETALTAGAVTASLTAFILWRSALRAQCRRGALPMPQAESEWLDEAALDDAAQRLVRLAQAAPTFETALHAAARVLRCELGAREVSVQAVVALEPTHASLSELVEAQPGFRAVARRVRLDVGATGRALALGETAGEPPGVMALPVLGGSRVVALIELVGVELPVRPAALREVLECARRTLSALAPPQGLALAGGALGDAACGAAEVRDKPDVADARRRRQSGPASIDARLRPDDGADRARASAGANAAAFSKAGIGRTARAPGTTNGSLES